MRGQLTTLIALNPFVPRVQTIKIHQFSFNWRLLALFVKENGRFWYWLSWALGTDGLKSSVLAACNIFFLKTINYIEVQKYLFGINGLTLDT